MELKILEDKKNRLVVEIKGEDHTLCNALKAELWNDKKVTVASYRIAHPLVGIPTLIVETESSTAPKKALQNAISRLSKQNDEFKKEVKAKIK
ncbi:DNA-directed RNA polymerase subunit L [Candidatus Woesearchaeota archaeon]|nr:DNA-directed RNA polymerase subunit L [Candidatus Woesearchaeota archaeon]